jgi:hypothetical protein
MLWEPIEDLQSDWKNLASSELPPLVTVFLLATKHFCPQFASQINQ